jgi:hypothetical protein
MTSEEHKKKVEAFSRHLIDIMTAECAAYNTYNDVSFLSGLIDSLDDARGEVEVWLDRAMSGRAIGFTGVDDVL